MNKYNAIIYDIDGTILNTLNMNMYPLLQIIKEETGETWSFDQVLKFAAYPGMKVMEELKIKNPEATYARWVKYVNAYEEGATLYLQKHTNSMNWTSVLKELINIWILLFLRKILLSTSQIQSHF